MSDDGTQDIITSYSKEFDNIKYIMNPERYVPSGFNRALSVCRGDLIVRVDGHAVLEKDYFSTCVNLIKKIDVDCVGGSIFHQSNTKIGRAIMLAQSSKFGSGGASFRRKIKKGKYVNTLAFGAYKRSVFKKIGGYDEELIRNQDDEFNFRMLQNGMKIWIDPSINSTYFSRNKYSNLFTQYFGYGKYKVKVFQKRKALASVRHVVPLFFVVSIILGIFILISKNNSFLITLIFYSYLISCLISTVGVLRGKKLVKNFQSLTQNFFNIFLISFSYFIMHFAYGLGFLIGLIVYANKWNDRTVKDYHFNSKVFNNN
tara:strand:+ start:234 stop:1178 length:945 start_codon:yes stop_codon:yes gene_type:complete